MQGVSGSNPLGSIDQPFSPARGFFSTALLNRQLHWDHVFGAAGFPAARSRKSRRTGSEARQLADKGLLSGLFHHGQGSEKG
jgi:hypothetical protein